MSGEPAYAMWPTQPLVQHFGDSLGFCNQLSSALSGSLMQLLKPNSETDARAQELERKCKEMQVCKCIADNYILHKAGERKLSLPPNDWRQAEKYMSAAGCLEHLVSSSVLLFIYFHVYNPADPKATKGMHCSSPY
jgi:hypothetical protein